MYDQYYNVSEYTDNKGQKYRYVYDAFANVLSAQDPRQYVAGKTVYATYNSWNDILTSKDSRGVSTIFNRGSIPGTLTSVTDGNGNTTGTYTYNSDGTIATASSQGVTTQINYDSQYRPNNVVTPDGSATIVYGSGVLVGKPTSVITRLGTSIFSYDDWGRLTGTTRFDGAIASVAMSVIGDINSATDVLNHTTTLTRDGIGRVTAVQNARGDTEHYNFDNDGQLTWVQNGNNAYRYYTYTARSELKQIQFADGNTEKYLFDGNGNQTRRINGLTQTIQYDYDTCDNLTTVTYPTGTPTTFTYDYDGRQLTMVDSTGTSSWTYDNADNVTQLVTPQGTMNYVYDVWNRRSKLSEGSVDTIYTYTNEKLTNIAKSADSVSTTLSYDSYGRLITKNDGATSTTYGYDANDRLNDIAHANSSGTFHQEHYTYDYANNLTTKIVNSVATSYTYDSIDQLLTENGGGLANTYGYDSNGNRTSKISTAGTEILSYDAADKLLTRSGVGASTTYSYDACGRTYQISRGGVTKTLTWDYEDRLTNIVAGTIPSTNYTYNGVGTRVSKSNSIGSRTYKRDGVGVTAPVLSDGLASMVPGISEKTGSTTSFVHSDHLGSMKALSSSGAVTDTASYDAFGNVVSRTGTNATQKGFAGGFGYQEDGESGYKLLGHRYYDPETGRFLSRDGTKFGRNWYGYSNNNPLKYVDQDGNRPLSATERHAVEKWISILIEEGYYYEAGVLIIMLNDGKIEVDDELEGGWAKAGVTADGKTLHLSPDMFDYSDVKAASILLHESSHVIDHFKGGILYGTSSEDTKTLIGDFFFALSEVRSCDTQLDFLMYYSIDHSDEVSGDISLMTFEDTVVDYRITNVKRFMFDTSLLFGPIFGPIKNPAMKPGFGKSRSL